MTTRDWGRFVLHHGSNLDVLRTMPANSVDSIVTDPPYGLAFMGKKWDYEVPTVEQWAECLRVLKPGGHLLSFAGTRTQHRMAVNIEDGGFEIRDTIAWIYSSGFPKSLDVSKALDAAAGAERDVIGEHPNPAGNSLNMSAVGMPVRASITAPATDAAREWQGWGTALKPAFEPITLARKPFACTVAANVLAHGTGALNIDASRVPAGESTIRIQGSAEIGFHGGNFAPGLETGSAAGRWPANLVHDGSDEVLGVFPTAPGQQAAVSTTAPSPRTSNVYGAMKRNQGGVGFKMMPGTPRFDTGSAARFFYCSKASSADRHEGLEAKGNSHPTVKPTDLMRYLVTLVTPPGGVVLDPWMGSGSTGKAAVPAGFRFIGIDRDDWLDVAERRIATATWGVAAFGVAA